MSSKSANGVSMGRDSWDRRPEQQRFVGQVRAIA